MKIRNIFGICLCAAAMMLPAVASAQEVQGNEAMGFSRIVRDPSRAARGFAGVADSRSTAWSSFSNSALIPYSSSMFDLDLVYQNWAPGGLKSSNLALGTAFRFGERIGLSAGFAMQSGEPYQITNSSGALKGTFTPADLQVNLGFAYKFADLFSLGVNARYLRTSVMDDASYSAIGADVFAQCRLAGVDLALGVSNIGSSVRNSEDERIGIPSSVTLGAGYGLEFARVHQIRLDLDADYFFIGRFSAAAGLEYGFNDMVFVRGGYHYGSEAAVLPSFATVGLGVKFFGVKLDVAYLTANDYLGNTLTVGLGYTF